jgi:hypothetical protein
MTIGTDFEKRRQYSLSHHLESNIESAYRISKERESQMNREVCIDEKKRKGKRYIR